MWNYVFIWVILNSGMLSDMASNKCIHEQNDYTLSQIRAEIGINKVTTDKIYIY